MDTLVDPTGFALEYIIIIQSITFDCRKSETDNCESSKFLLPALDIVISISSYSVAMSLTNLYKTNGSRFFTEALTAKIKTVFANETSLMCTQAARVTTGQQQK